MLNDEIRLLIIQIIALWNKTEAIIKKAEMIDGRVVDASINELRYAGRCLIDIFAQIISENPDLNEIKALFNEVKKNVEKAHNDSVDAIVLTLRKKIELLESKFKRLNIAKHIPSYTQTKRLLDEADVYIIDSRLDRTKRTITYEAIVLKHIDDILNCLKSIEANKKLLVEEAENEIKNTKNHTYTRLGFVATVIFGLTGWIILFFQKS